MSLNPSPFGQILSQVVFLFLSQRLCFLPSVLCAVPRCCHLCLPSRGVGVWKAARRQWPGSPWHHGGREPGERTRGSRACPRAVRGRGLGPGCLACSGPTPQPLLRETPSLLRVSQGRAASGTRCHPLRSPCPMLPCSWAPSRAEQAFAESSKGNLPHLPDGSRCSLPQPLTTLTLGSSARRGRVGRSWPAARVRATRVACTWEGPVPPRARAAHSDAGSSLRGCPRGRPPTVWPQGVISPCSLGRTSAAVAARDRMVSG